MRRYCIAVIFILFGAGTCVLAQDIDISSAGAIINAAEVLNDTTASANDAAKPLNDEAKKKEKKPSKGLLFFYRTGDWVDRYLMRGIDSDYIALPEHSWRLAYTNAMVGVNSTLNSSSIIPFPTGPQEITNSLLNKTTPSVDLGFYAGFRGFGFGYAWDALNAYARRLSFTLGSKFIGIDFSLQTSTNIHSVVSLNGIPQSNVPERPDIVITNANLSAWYALNAKHYSHQAAVKQSFIQRKTAGSLLLHLAYMSSQVEIQDTMKLDNAKRPLISSMMSDITAVRTRQIAAGIGYGINYTPNHGKVVLHLSAAAMLVAYSVNHVSYYFPYSIANELPSGEPMFNLHSMYPVHVTGNMRAAVSWEINKWVHLSAWATGDNIRFRSKPTAHENVLALDNWNWKVQLVVGVRFGAGRDRVQKALYGEKPNPDNILKGREDDTSSSKKSRVPKWITDFFWSPKD